MAFRLLLIGLTVLYTATAQQDIPFCLQACLTQVGTNLCAEHALNALTPCLSKTCPNPPATQNLIASLNVAFTPKAEYSCQQAYGPSDAEQEGSSVTLPLNGSCATSPYGFKSFLPQGVSRIRASNGCRVMIFSDVDCLGEEASSDIGTLSNGQCVFRGGRSARLACENELDAARAYIQANCGKDNDDDTDPDSKSSSSLAGSSTAGFFHGGPGPVSIHTSTTTSTSTSIPFHWPFSSATDSSTTQASTNTADAAGSSSPGITSDGTVQTLAIPTAMTASGTGWASTNGTTAAQNGSQSSVSSSESQNTTAVLTLTLAGTPTSTPGALPPFTGLAANLDGSVQMAIALGLVGVIFAFFL